MTLAPIRRELLVPAEPAVAFAVFTSEIASWWPVSEHSVYGAGAHVAFVDGEIVETAPGHEPCPWGRVTEWEPPTVLSFSWHPGSDPARASQVTVTFSAVGGRTLVRLEHSGWEQFADPVAARAEYEKGWPVVLDGYCGAVPAGSWTWVALLHRPTASAPAAPTLFADPRFGGHIAFLERMRTAGYLVAAGPLGDEPGAGMTVLRLPGSDRMAEATALATSEDLGVAGGLFDVVVRPWQVALQA